MNMGIEAAARWIAIAMVVAALLFFVLVLIVSSQWRWTVLELHRPEQLPPGAYKLLDETKPVMPSEPQGEECK